MEKCPKSTPFSLNNFSLTNSHNAFEDMSLAFGENIFAESKDIELITEEVKEKVEKEITNKKRLNDLDNNILGGVTAINKRKRNSLIQKISTFIKEKNLEPKFFKNLNKIAFFLFPAFTKSKSIKDSIKELKMINKNTKSLISTKIPFGENQERYKDLSDNIARACNIQANLRKKIG